MRSSGGSLRRLSGGGLFGEEEAFLEVKRRLLGAGRRGDGWGSLGSSSRMKQVDPEKP